MVFFFFYIFGIYYSISENIIICLLCLVLIYIFISTFYSPSNISCDYETKLERVNIQVIKESGNFSEPIKIKMTLIDGDKNEYPTECIINNNTGSYCLFIPPKNDTNLYYKNNCLNLSEESDIITIEDDFYVIAQKCEGLRNIGKVNNTETIYKIFSHSGSWCDYETKLGRVNLQVQKMRNPMPNLLKLK